MVDAITAFFLRLSDVDFLRTRDCTIRISVQRCIGSGDTRCEYYHVCHATREMKRTSARLQEGRIKFAPVSARKSKNKGKYTRSDY